MAITNKYLLRGIFLVWVMWMAAIFYFSSLSGSSVYYEPPLWLVIQRKGAHVFEYFVLTFLSFQVARHLFTTKESFQKILLVAVAWSLMYAVTDELHQYFSPFRGAHMRDVLIDGIGILVAVLMLLLLSRTKYKKTLSLE